MNLVEFLLEQGKVVSPTVHQHLKRLDDPRSWLIQAIEALPSAWLNQTWLDEAIAVVPAAGGVSPVTVAPELSAAVPAAIPTPFSAAQVRQPVQRPVGFTPPLAVAPRAAFQHQASDYDTELTVHLDITGNSTCVGKITDFSKLFSDRLSTLRRLLGARKAEFRQSLTIRQAHHQAGSNERDFHLVGIVTEIRNTKNGHLLVELEDETDTVLAFFRADSDVSSFDFITDEVVGVVGKFAPRDSEKKRGLFYVDEFYRPDLPSRRQGKRAQVPVSAAFVSDVHVGSRTFLEKEWNRMIRWLHGEVDEYRDVARSIKYLVLSGDNVDGIGIFPGQKDELVLDNIFEQYKALANWLSQVPDHIQILMLPGNHDAVRQAEPQPTFGNTIQEYFEDVQIEFVGNPSFFTAHGVDILSYHGRSMDDWIPSNPKLSYEDPIDSMKEMLRRRHLAPIWGKKTPLAPEHRDYLTINSVPDIFVAGHVHAHNTTQWRDVRLIASSTWQSQTSFQRMMGFRPKPAVITVVNLQTFETTSVDFGKHVRPEPETEDDHHDDFLEEASHLLPSLD